MYEILIESISLDLVPELQSKIDGKAKPVGALGQLEELAMKVGSMQETLTPSIEQPTWLVFVGDHGVAKEMTVNKYPQAVTAKMVNCFLQGNAAINVFCKQHHLNLKVIDAGVNFNFASPEGLIQAKVAMGTKNYLVEPAMTQEQMLKALNKGGKIVQELAKESCNFIGFGEMGIGNTSSASLIMSHLLDIPLIDCIGQGAGLSKDQLLQKIQNLTWAHGKYSPNSMYDVLCCYGGFEIVMMCGAMLEAAKQKMTLLIDGFIVSVALLAASKINSNVLDWCLYAHQSNEHAHANLLRLLKAKPLLDLDMRLGEGTGAAVAYPLIVSAVNFLNEMATLSELMDED